MHIVAIAWLYVTLMMALVHSSPLAGAAFFLFVGLAPVVLLALLVLRRHRTRQERESVRKEHVHTADNRDSQSDQ